MLALRTAIRCNSTLSIISQNALRSKKLKMSANRRLDNSLNPSRDISVTKLHIEPTVLSGYFMQRCTFATNPGDIDVKQLVRVYYGSLTPRMRAVKVFSLVTSLTGLAAQPILLEQGMKMGGTGLAIFLCTFAGFFTFVTPFLLHFITKKYVTEIHYNPETKEYVATTINIILQKVRTKFHPSDVTIPEVPGMFTSFNIGKRSLFVDPVLFEDPEHYVRIMGYDKPIDFKLDLKQATSTIMEDVNKQTK